MSRLFKLYKEKIVPQLKQELEIDNDLAVPRVEKVTINVGVGSIVKNKKNIDNAIDNVKRISGQAPVKTYSRQAISGFGVKENQLVGLKVTLRGTKMYDFLDRLISITLPRVRDFRGLSIKSFDGQGNYNIGFKEQIVFSEVRTDEVEEVHGLEICITTSAKDDQAARALLKLLGFPFKEK
ncbi:50S ribosomal protein L5 [Patescibacteria group bacterium]|nr:50S ribosomal protein L5 [Patescibacteria group bacterium]